MFDTSVEITKVSLPYLLRQMKIVLSHKEIWVVGICGFAEPFFLFILPMKNSCMSESRVHSLLKGFCATRTTKITKNLIFANVAEQTRGHPETTSSR